MKRIKQGDEVIVIAGRSKGQRGNVLRVKKDGRLLVNNVNTVKKHVKPNPQIEEKGGIKTMEAPIHASNVMLYNAASGKGERVGFKVTEDGRKVRVFKSNGEQVDA
ncbi:50S ribosomal protein L24 [Marinicella sp. S6413]|uniref:50S ribosomal protein L24 n=1 Tax=Marinicella gelatinilytica TaxID=2996017 RepID=UPI002260EC00|nr:50S ribosomal protein L24 [Marinicella gelatinilytica]MCX7546164.1 50S ribosomal protein L24 [Marinicella gelatinilytica]